MGVWIISEAKTGGARKPDTEGITYLLGFGGKKLYDPEGVAQEGFHIFPNVASRWDADSEKYYVGL